MTEDLIAKAHREWWRDVRVGVVFLVAAGFLAYGNFDHVRLVVLFLLLHAWNLEGRNP
jgi:hypothetical protein